MDLRQKKGQLTLFIIIAIVLVIALVILFLIRSPTMNFFQSQSPSEYLDNCIKPRISNALSLILSHGGSINPKNYFKWQNNNLDYLCYTNQYYQTCVIQRPLLKQHIEEEMTNFVYPGFNSCISSFKKIYEKKGYSVNIKNNPEFSIKIFPRKLIAELNSEIILKKNSEAIRYKRMKFSIDSGLYNLIMISLSILNSEARYGDSESLIYSFYYPNIRIQKLKQSDGTKVYIIEDTRTSEKFIFASRSLSWPAGYGFGERYVRK